MGSSSKRARNAKESDSYSEDLSDFENDQMTVDSEEEEEESDGVELKDGDEEERSSDDEEQEAKENEDGGEDDEMEELEKEYMDLRHQEQDILKNIKRHKDEDILKGQAVNNQKALWDKTLEFRFLLQKAFSSSNRLPQEPVRSSFCESDEGVSTAYSDLITSSKKTLDSLLELQEALLEKNPSIAQSPDGNTGKTSKRHSEDDKNLDAEGDEDWGRISHMHKRYFEDLVDVLLFSNAKLTFYSRAVNISDQVAAYMRDPSRMIKQMQQRRSTVGVFEAVAVGVDNTKGKEENPDGDPELLDDSEFYQQLLKEFFETIDPTSSESAFYAIKKMQTKKRKIIDRRASKSRKIRYNVHEKIVNFMAPQPMDLPPMAPKLFENLFGLKTQKPASVA
ncbi:hypothetical protein WN944_009676 [Citrus x changshan-huyou]|uniref:Uncharacterized protein n=1 Tax=Citrus x changshan-huyou TaxID=2935761 RepID=A0AAP0MQ87_9ROSI